MLDKIPSTHKVYINTTLPISEHQSEEDIVSFTRKNRNKITCINVSRHMQRYVVESNDLLLSRLAVPFRINCVLYKNYPVRDLIPYLDRFHQVPGSSIQFRFDYTATTPDNLYEEEGDKILQDLKKFSSYTGLDGCRMRCGFHFDYHGMVHTLLFPARQGPQGGSAEPPASPPKFFFPPLDSAGIGPPAPPHSAPGRQPRVSRRSLR